MRHENGVLSTDNNDILQKERRQTTKTHCGNEIIVTQWFTSPFHFGINVRNQCEGKGQTP